MAGTRGHKPQLQDEVAGCRTYSSSWRAVMVLGLSFWPQSKQPHDASGSVVANVQLHGNAPVAVELVRDQDGLNTDFKFIIPLASIPEPVEATTVNAKMCG